MNKSLIASVNVNKILSSNVVKGTGVITFGIFVVNIINYFFQIVLGRMISIEDFGLFNALLSLTYVLAVPGNALSVSIIKMVSELKSEKDFSTLTSLYKGLTIYSLMLGGFFSIVILIMHSLIADYLNLSSSQVLIPFAIYLGLTYLNLHPNAYLQGLLRFKGFAFYHIISSLFRFAIPLSLVYSGFRVGGIYMGMAFALILAYVTGTLILKKNFDEYTSQNLEKYYQKLIKFSLSVVVVQVCVTFLVNIDLILVKHFYDTTSVGIYAGVVTIGKVLLFGAGVISSAMLPIVADAYSSGENLKNKFIAFFMLQLCVVVVGVMVFNIFPELITSILFGEKYISAVEFIPRYSVFIGLYSLTNFLVLFAVAIERVKVYILLVIASLLQLILLNVFNSTLNQVISVNLFVIVSLFILIAFYLYVEYKNSAA